VRISARAAEPRPALPPPGMSRKSTVAGVVFLGLKMAESFQRRSSGTGTRASGSRLPEGSDREIEVRDWKRVDFPDWVRPVRPMDNDMGPALLREGVGSCAVASQAAPRRV